MADVIKLELTIDETNQVLAGLGELPSKTNAWNLDCKNSSTSTASVTKT
jgi:hypothetical protein